jgi:hypothetical protein
MKFVIKFTDTSRFWIKSENSNRYFTRVFTYIRDIPFWSVFMIETLCILCKVRAHTEGKFEDLNDSRCEYEILGFRRYVYRYLLSSGILRSIEW